MPARHPQTGFTLIELLIAMAIAAILVGLAVPAFRGLLGTNTMSAAVNTYVHSLRTARSEAVKRALPAAVCASAAPLAATPDCSSGASFADGWIVYVDADGNGTRSGTDEVLLQTGPGGGGLSFTSDATIGHQVYFDASGRSVNVGGTPLAGGVRITLAGHDDTRRVEVSASGHIATVTP